MEYDFQSLTDKFYQISMKSLFFSKYQPFCFSRKPYFRNISLWENGESDFLFIIGNSGSGKTFFSKKLQMEGVIVIEFDDVLNWFVNREEILKKWTNEEYRIIYPFVNKLEEENSKYINDNLRVDAYDKIIKPFIEYLFDSKLHKKVILEGVWIAYYDPMIIKNYPLILLRTSFIISWQRRSKRENEGIFECIKQKWHENIGWKNIIEKFMMNLHFWDKTNKLR